MLSQLFQGPSPHHRPTHTSLVTRHTMSPGKLGGGGVKMWEGHDGERGVGDYDKKVIIGYNPKLTI